MATNYEYDDEDDFTEESGDVVKQLRKVNRTLEKRLKELETESVTLKTQSRQRIVKDVLTQKGINPKVAAFIPQDLDSSEEAITNWINEYGDVFGVNTNAEESNQQQGKASTPDLSAQNRINNIVNTGMPSTPDEDSLAKILNAKSAEELNAILGISVI
jgi:beta-phosphoglucomutase-like phosphatase (HAD superfamily)